VQLRIQTHNRSRRHAFTLMEVLVVVAILVVLAGIGVMVFRYLDESKEKIAKMGIKNIETAVTAYKLSHGNYPESLVELTQPTEGKAAYMEDKALFDPWNHPYVYDPGTQNPKTGMPLIYSQGANPGSSPQIRNWP
jgi:general secretion pathway protein G